MLAVSDVRMLCRFKVLNQRQPVAFALFRNISRAGNFSAEDIVARSPVLSFASENEPTQGHLALTGDSTYVLRLIMQHVSEHCSLRALLRAARCRSSG